MRTSRGVPQGHREVGSPPICSANVEPSSSASRGIASGESPRTAGVKSCEFPELPIGSDMLLPLAQGGTIHSRFGLALVRVLRKHLLSGENRSEERRVGKAGG